MTLTHRAYTAGHPWYYLLGGTIPSIKTIRASVLANNYDGYLARIISEMDIRAEPQRSAKLEALRERIASDLRDDISRYRTCACELRRWRANCDETAPPACSDVHTAISLKHNHIANGFANLRTLERLPRQADLFADF